jgi:hypothetical protein
LLSVLKLTAFIVKEDFCIENVTDASIFCIQNLFKGKDDQLSVIGRLAAGACAGMTSTLLTYPLDVLRLRLAVEPGYRTMSQVKWFFIYIISCSCIY